MTRPPSTATAARPASTPAPVGRDLLTDEQRDILREATAYRFPHFSIGYWGGGAYGLDVSASTINRNRMLWKPHRLGRGTIGEMNQLRKAAMAEYNRLTRGSR